MQMIIHANNCFNWHNCCNLFCLTSYNLFHSTLQKVGLFSPDMGKTQSFGIDVELLQVSQFTESFAAAQ